MLATLMNGLAFGDCLKRAQLKPRLFSSVPISGIARGYSRDDAVQALEEGAVVILAGGTGNPLFTTDTTATLRGIEIGADCVLKATKVDGVYSADPMLDPAAIRYDRLTYDQVISQDLKVMDTAAFALARDAGLASVGTLTRLINGEMVGTRID